MANYKFIERCTVTVNELTHFETNQINSAKSVHQTILILHLCKATGVQLMNVHFPVSMTSLEHYKLKA